MITAENVRDLFNYDPVSGVLSWRVFVSPKAPAGAAPSSRDKDGYIKVSYKGKHYRAHRVAWLWMTGEWPVEIDHINRTPDDNRWKNLRNVSSEINQQNRSGFKNNTGVVGVVWDKYYRKFSPKIKAFGKAIYLGRWDDLEFAELVYQEAKRKFHPQALESLA